MKTQTVLVSADRSGGAGDDDADVELAVDRQGFEIAAAVLDDVDARRRERPPVAREDLGQK